jgi:hypothetical protein
MEMLKVPALILENMYECRRQDNKSTLKKTIENYQ